MSERKRILWLVSWYPNKYDAFDGDFIQRHAKAAALYDDVYVLFVKASEQQQKTEAERRQNNGLTEHIIYHPKQNGFWGKLKNLLQWRRLHQKAVAEIYRNFSPHYVHVHVPWKAGLIALWMKKKYKIPFFVTEHWGLYNTIVDDNIFTKSFFVRYLLKKIYKKAKAFVTVSRYLGNGVNQTLVNKPYTVIPNVVDTALFQPSPEKNGRFTFLHVSNMVPLKNAEGILLAFQQFLHQTAVDAQLLLVGNRDDALAQKAQKLNLLGNYVFFTGEVSYGQVATHMQRAHVFVLNSLIETFSCVVSEALCCGLPVIATNAGGVPELVNGQNGILVAVNNQTELTNAMLKMYTSYDGFDREQIAMPAQQRFSFASVGLQFHQLYRS